MIKYAKNKSLIFYRIYNYIKRFDKFKILLLGYTISKKNEKKLCIKSLKIVYNIHNSLPETTNGYAIRSHTIAKAIQNENINISVVTRVGFPLDIDFIARNQDENKVHIVDNIEYIRLQKQGFHLEECTLSKYLANYTDMLIKVATKKNATIIHSSSNYMNGLAGVSAANILGIPSIYEVRGFWEITKASREPKFRNSLGYKLQKKLEIQACQEATSVIALSEIVKEELVDRGINKSKIFVVPNAVNTDKLRPISKNIDLLNKLSFSKKFVVGFIGSVVDYEGLSLLVKAAKRLNNTFLDRFRYLIVGDGNDLENLRSLVKQLDLEELFIFVGRVPYEEVEKYYSEIDIFCYPRLDWEVCQIVSPKKPFEAMAYGKPIISSSVRANSYFIEDGVNGLIHKKESVESLVSNIEKLYEDDELRKNISKNAREWVVQNRDSRDTGKLLKIIYHNTQEKFYR